MTNTPTVRAPKGFFFKIEKEPYYKYSYNPRVLPKKLNRPGNVYVKLYDRNHQYNDRYHIGYIQLEVNNSKWYVTHSYLDLEYRSKGLGTLLYARAIKWCFDNGYKCRSSYSSSWLAKNVWEGQHIKKFFHIKKRKINNAFGGKVAYFPSIKN
jgi:GNAT superfamily N-acetyltransferase